MSTRSGRRIHLSFHENTLKSEAEIPKSERKTRSKHTKENLEESQPIPKAKKRNYVAYPGDNVTGVDAVDGKDEGRTTRALRKNALKERNCGSPTEVVDPPTENKPAIDLTKSVRSTRRPRKFPEKIEDAPESTPKDEEQLSKPKKDKKKKKKAEKEELEEEDFSKQQKLEVEVKAVPKKKSKKKKGRGSGSIVVEDIEPEAPSTLNKSNVSVDSFHSAAGSPRNTDNEVDVVPKDMDKVIKVRKTRSSGKPDISSNQEETEKQLRIRKSSRKMAMDVSEDDADKGVDSIIRNSNSGDTLLLPNTKDELNNSTIDVKEKKNTSSRKSKRSTFDKTMTPRKVSTTNDKKTITKNKILDVTLIADEAVGAAEANVNTTLGQEVDVQSVKSTRKSAINVNTTFAQDVDVQSVKSTRKSAINVNTTLGQDVDVQSVKSTRKSAINVNTTLRQDVDVQSVKSTRKSAINVNTTLGQEVDVQSVKSTRKSAINVNTTFGQDVDVQSVKSTRKSAINVNTTLGQDVDVQSVKSTRKSPINVNTTFAQDVDVQSVKSTRKSAINVNTTFAQDVDVQSMKSTRKSAINAWTLITNNKPTPKKSNKKKFIANDLLEYNVEANISEDKKSLVNATYSYISAGNSSPIKQSEEIMNTTVGIDLVSEFVKGKRKSAINATTQISHNNKLTPKKSIKRKSIDMNTSENDIEAKVPEDKKSIFAATYITAENSSPLTNKVIKNSIVNTNFEKELEPSSDLELETKKNETYDLTSSPFKSAYEVSSPMRMDDVKRKAVINNTVENDNSHHVNENCKSINNKINTFKREPSQETVDKQNKRKSSVCISSKADSSNNSTFDIDQDKKLDTTYDKHSKSSIITSDSSMITLDKSNISRISITSDESKNDENILNSTPMLIESSLDESAINTTQTKVTTPVKNESTESVITPLKREGTFTKDETAVVSSPNTTPTKVTTPVKNDTTVFLTMKREGTFTKDETEVISSPKPRVSRTPTKRMPLPSPGFTPFHINKSVSKERSALMNITRSIEKRRSSLVEPPRTAKVMFCSPVNNPAVVNQIKKKVIKSNLKGSNKSFVFDESALVESRPANRKRSYTYSDVDDARVKRKRLATDLQQSVNRLSRPRTSSASAKLAEPNTPSKKSESKISRTKLPNFAALHQKSFDKMESLNQCQERKARRARQLLTPNGAVAMLDRISPKDKTTDQEKPPEKSKDASEKRKESGKSKEASKPDTPIKSLPPFKSLNPGYTRFGFKLNLDVNPFSIPSKPVAKTVDTKPKENKPNGLTRQAKAILPSLAGATSVRREVAKQTVMREKSFTDRRNEKRTENRTVIKGVRTNRRFELQMKMRDI